MVAWSQPVMSSVWVPVSWRDGGKLLQKIDVDGLVESSRVVFLNSTKHTPSLKHVTDVVSDAKKLQGMLEHLTSLSTEPENVKVKLEEISRLPIVPFLSSNICSAAVEAKCRKEGVGIVRPSGEGFVVVEPTHALKRGAL